MTVGVQLDEATAVVDLVVRVDEDCRWHGEAFHVSEHNGIRVPDRELATVDGAHHYLECIGLLLHRVDRYADALLAPDDVFLWSQPTTIESL